MSIVPPDFQSVPRTAKCSPAEGLEGPVYIVQNELSITNSGPFGPSDGGSGARESPFENLPRRSEKLPGLPGECETARLTAREPVHRGTPGALSYPLRPPLG